MRQPSARVVTFMILTAVCAVGFSWSASGEQPRRDEVTLIAHRYHVGQTPAVRKEAEAQKTSPLEARRDLARTELSELLPVPPPRGLLVARAFLTAVAERLRGRVLDGCEMTDTSVDCPTHYLTPHYPRVFLRLRYVYDKQDVELHLGATHRSLEGVSTAAQDRLSLEDAEWYQNLFLKLVDLTMARK